MRLRLQDDRRRWHDDPRCHEWVSGWQNIEKGDEHALYKWGYGYRWHRKWPLMTLEVTILLCCVLCICLRFRKERKGLHRSFCSQPNNISIWSIAIFNNLFIAAKKKKKKKPRSPSVNNVWQQKLFNYHRFQSCKFCLMDHYGYYNK